ncbi:hypothetical protein SAMN05444745_103285 [Arthrobacter sp. OV608]|nr:hypothetical protein SAMN05444745_103285 [Arthrobacter sp. OV608]
MNGMSLPASWDSGSSRSQGAALWRCNLSCTGGGGYDAGRKVYDSVAGRQKDGGVTEESVHRVADDPRQCPGNPPNSVDTALAFFSRDDLREALQSAAFRAISE